MDNTNPPAQLLYNASKRKNERPRRWNGGAITFLRKMNAADTMGNYRPITLVNIIHDIWATIMSTRLTPILNIIPAESQYAYKKSNH